MMRKIIRVAFACISLLAASKITAADTQDLPGLKITKPGETPTDLQLAKELRRHVDKCAGDSKAFRDLLKELKEYSLQRGRELRIGPMRASIGDLQHTFVTTASLDRFFVDLDDLEVYPNPLKVDDKFETIDGVPPWAEFLCSALGHEIAEHLSMMKNEDLAVKAGLQFDREEDRKISHYRVANPLSDAVSKDYNPGPRERKDDCSRPHAGHTDSVWEIAPHGLLILHQTPPSVSFGSDGRPTSRHESSGRLGYISYEPGARWPGKQAGSAKCLLTAQ